MKVDKSRYDFEGWASKNDLRCADGRIIRKDAFASQDGQIVPLVYQHNHQTPSAVLGHALLENRDEGLYAYGSFNATQAGQDSKELLKHGDIVALSIWANNLQQKGSDVFHGAVREVSIVLAGANPGAFVESVIAHGMPLDEEDEEGIIYSGEGVSVISHAEKGDEPELEEPETEGGSLKEVYNTLTDKQKQAVAAIIAELELTGEEPDENEDEEGEVMHSIFESQGTVPTRNYLSHDDMAEIFKNAKRTGSLKDAYNEYVEENELSHAIPTTGMEVPSTATADQAYGFRDPDMLLPDYKAVDGNQPDFISRNMAWVSSVMNGVKKVPFARIKTLHADITEDEARAKGYMKGNKKKEEVFTLLKRTTDPQTIYKKQKLDKDDIYDISDFDIVLWLKGEMRVMLDEEKARAILIGDGRAADSEDKIKEDHIRPIVKDVDLYNIKVKVTPGTTSADTAKNTIDQVIRSRKQYKGSGNPTFYTTEDVITEMLLLENKIGDKIYKTEGELATALRVSSIIPVEPMEGYKIGGEELIGVIVNLSDYTVGNNKLGGSDDVFEDFDIDYNQYKYLMEDRFSGALTKPFSAITLTKAATSSGGSSGSGTPGTGDGSKG